MRNVLLALPSILGILSLACFALYFYSANHTPYTFIDALLLGPPLSLAGVLVCIFNRQSRKDHPAPWGIGFALCIVGFVVCAFVFGALAAFMSAVLSEG